MCCENEAEPIDEAVKYLLKKATHLEFLDIQAVLPVSLVDAVCRLQQRYKIGNDGSVVPRASGCALVEPVVPGPLVEPLVMAWLTLLSHGYKPKIESSTLQGPTPSFLPTESADLCGGCSIWFTSIYKPQISGVWHTSHWLPSFQAHFLLALKTSEELRKRKAIEMHGNLYNSR